MAPVACCLFILPELPGPIITDDVCGHLRLSVALVVGFTSAAWASAFSRKSYKHIINENNYFLDHVAHHHDIMSTARRDK